MRPGSRKVAGPWSTAVGAEVRRLREAKGMSQLELSLAIEIHQGGLSKRERGKIAWDTNLLAKTAEVLGTTASVIVRRVEAALALEDGLGP